MPGNNLSSKCRYSRRENTLDSPTVLSRHYFLPFGPFHCRDNNVRLFSVFSRQNYLEQRNRQIYTPLCGHRMGLGEGRAILCPGFGRFRL